MIHRSSSRDTAGTAMRRALRAGTAGLMAATLLHATPLASYAQTPTRVMVRVASHDAKIIGSGVGGARVTIRDQRTGSVLAEGIQEGGTGNTSLIMGTRERGASVYDTEVAQVRLPLTGRQVALLDLPLDYDDSRLESSTGAPVVLRARFANRMWEWQGRIVRTDASIDENSRVVYAVAEVDKPFAREPGSDRPPLSPGLFVNATIGGRELSDVTRLPRSALVRSGTVMVVDGGQRVREREVQVLLSDASRLWVQGLERGERVIVRDPAMAIAGSEVLTNTVAGLAGGGG